MPCISMCTHHKTVADAIILGNVLALCWRCRGWFGPSPTLAGTRRGNDHDKGKGRGRHASLASLSHRTAEGTFGVFII